MSGFGQRDGYPQFKRRLTWTRGEAARPEGIHPCGTARGALPMQRPRKAAHHWAGAAVFGVRLKSMHG